MKTDIFHYVVFKENLIKDNLPDFKSFWQDFFFSKKCKLISVFTHFVSLFPYWHRFSLLNIFRRPSFSYKNVEPSKFSSPGFFLNIPKLFSQHFSFCIETNTKSIFVLDPRVKKWTLVGSPFPTLIIIAIYLLAVLKILPLYIKNRKPLELVGVIRYYNILQIALCITIIYKVRKKLLLYTCFKDFVVSCCMGR